MIQNTWTVTKKTEPNVLVLRTCDANLKGYGGFQWPEKGPVKCSDWNPDPVCGGGLHGLLWGCGKGDLLDWSTDAKWLVVEVAEDSIVAIDEGEKVKFPSGRVVFCGGRTEATVYISERGAAGMPVVGAVRAAGHSGTATAGDYGTATAGDRGTIQISWGDGSKSRRRIATGYVGEDGIKPNTPYRVEDGKFVEVMR